MAQFARVAQLAEELATTSSRLKKRAAIAEAIAAVHTAAPTTEDAGLSLIGLLRRGGSRDCRKNCGKKTIREYFNTPPPNF